MLLHVPESGQHTVRHYGLYAGASRKKRNNCRELLGGLLEKLQNTEEPKTVKLTCRCCGSEMRLKWAEHPKSRKGISYIQALDAGHVQHADEPDIGQGKKKIEALRL